MLAIDEQVGDLADLGPGWYDALSLPYAKEHLDRLAAVLHRSLDFSGIPAPHIYPSRDGDVEIEWTRDNWEISLTISFSKNDIWAHVADVNTDDFFEEHWALRDDTSAESLRRFLSKYFH